MMRALEGRAEALGGTFKAQEVANTLWSACVFSLLFDRGHGWRWLDAVVQRLASLGDASCFIAVQLHQIHQFLVCCRLEPRIRMEAIKDMWSLKEACREAFVCSKSAPSAMQQQVSETLRRIGLSVEDEVRCPKSGYSIDMIAVLSPGREMGGESSSSTWAVEVDGPSHFLTSRAPTGATLLKRRCLELLGHALVTVPYWDWDGCKGPGEREQYLRGKLAVYKDRVQRPGNALLQRAGKVSADDDEL